MVRERNDKRKGHVEVAQVGIANRIANSIIVIIFHSKYSAAGGSKVGVWDGNDGTSLC